MIDVFQSRDLPTYICKEKVTEDKNLITTGYYMVKYSKQYAHFCAVNTSNE